MRLTRFATRDEMTTAAADAIAERIGAAIRDSGQAYVALAGGKTPRPVYRELATRDIEWDKVQLFMGDERWVDPGDERSNLRTIRDNLLDLAPIPDENVHPMVLDAEDDPFATGRAYETELQAFFGLEKGQLPSFDLVLLGMGPDGHTASLFPGYDASWVKGLVTATPEAPLPPHVERLSLTLPVLKNARGVIFMITGEDKLPVLGEILGDPLAAAQLYPAARVRPDLAAHKGELLWFWAP